MVEFLSLLIAHILADFYWQPSRWVADKRKKKWKAPALYAHIAVVTLVSYILLGYWSQPWIALVTGLVHGAIDLIKLMSDKKGSTAWFITDQVLHLISIAIIAGMITGSIPYSVLSLIDWLRAPEVSGVLAGVLFCMRPVSFLVGMFTKPWREELVLLSDQANDTLDNAGRWIGMSERVLAYTFVLLDQYAAIGFLIAAKSLLRYNDKHPEGISHTYISKKSEYVLVGTLMSFVCAIGAALIVKIFI